MTWLNWSRRTLATEPADTTLATREGQPAVTEEPTASLSLSWRRSTVIFLSLHSSYGLEQGLRVEEHC